MNDQAEENKRQSSLAPDETQFDAALTVARRIEQRLLRVEEKLKLGEYDDLRETVTRLHAYSQLLQATDHKQFLKEELDNAAKQIHQIERRLDRQRPTDRQQQADRKQDSGFSFGM